MATNFQRDPCVQPGTRVTLCGAANPGCAPHSCGSSRRKPARSSRAPPLKPLHAADSRQRSYPGQFQPVRHDGKLLVDGGMSVAGSTKLITDSIWRHRATKPSFCSQSGGWWS